MLIKYIKLKNFRQFFGPHSIEFSIDPQKKATLLIAENGTGKTTLLESFSWIFYGSCNLKTIINNKLKNKMSSGDTEVVEGEIGVNYLQNDYVIKRSLKIIKKNSGFIHDESVLSITTKDELGISREFRGTDANDFIKNMVPKSLFPYFFFKGESIEHIGKEISEGKNSKNSEFVKAIKGMLGFDHLYYELEDLKKLISEYNNEIASNKTDSILRDLQTKINNAQSDIEKYQELFNSTEKTLKELEKEKETISEEISKSGDVSEKQKYSAKLSAEIKNLNLKIENLKKELFSKFSSNSYNFIAAQLIKDAVILLNENGDIDKGIPGLNASAVDYIINKKRCICGSSVCENNEHYKLLVDLKKYLPPNNLGAEISKFKSIGNANLKLADAYYTSFIDTRRELREKESLVQQKSADLEKLDDEIKNYPDISKKKEREIELKKLITQSYQESAKYNYLLNEAKNNKASAEKDKSNYSITDMKIRNLEKCSLQVKVLHDRLNRFINRKEKEKRDELENAINSIFLEIFDIDVKIKLKDDFSIEMKDGDDTSLEDFQNSTAQDAIMAFSFIGGIIKTARNKRNRIANGEDDGISEMEMEPYPLLMDAPSSAFDIKRITYFCNVMPNIAEQVIFFIKDTDGLYVKNNIKSILGKEYEMRTVPNDKFQVEIKEVR